MGDQRHEPRTALEDRAQGALAGLAIGDAFGAPFEGSRHVEMEAVDRLLNEGGGLRYTDDTAMAMVLARSLIERGGLDGQHLLASFADEYEDEPWRGYGAGPPRIFAMLDDGVPWDEAAGRLFGGDGSFGNGGAMRVTPVAVFAAGDLARTARIARGSAAVTHTHPAGMDGAAAQACAVGAVLAGTSEHGPDAVLDEVSAQVDDEELATRLQRIRELLPSPSPSDIAGELGNGVTAMESVPAAICAALANLDDVAGTLRCALEVGGDTDTIAAMAASVTGANVGLGSLPPGFLRRAEGASELAELAGDLLSAGAEPR